MPNKPRKVHKSDTIIMKRPQGGFKAEGTLTIQGRKYKYQGSLKRAG